ncbi:MAG: CYTH domain-containing protein [Eubacteriales bacterium]|nr:CYTH domain-containing protein [Eubacteriales bacterium]
MEIELKYAVTNMEVSQNILDDKYLKTIKDKDSDEVINMKAIYYDTEDRDLFSSKIAFRVRQEGSKIVATVKWNGTSTDGLHEREEINVPVEDETFFEAPTLSIFKESPIEDKLLNISKGKKIIPIMEMVFTRKQMRIDTGKSISEISVDTGEIITKNGNAPICEVEIELYSGDKEDMEKLGNDLADRYNLVPENTSKYKRGLDLL